MLHINVICIGKLKEKYLQDYNGNETLLPEEIKAYAEGWYNIEDVTMDNVKGVSR